MPLRILSDTHQPHIYKSNYLKYPMRFVRMCAVILFIPNLVCSNLHVSLVELKVNNLHRSFVFNETWFLLFFRFWQYFIFVCTLWMLQIGRAELPKNGTNRWMKFDICEKWKGKQEENHYVWIANITTIDKVSWFLSFLTW